jgi:hypothetical protein
MKNLLYLLLILVAFASCNSENKADAVYKNGIIYTMESEGDNAEAMAVKDGEIVFVGSSAEAENWIFDKTEVIDLQGATVLPSFTDGHIHPTGGGLRLLSCDLTDIRSEDEIIAKIKKYAAENPDKEWIIGGGLWLPEVGKGNPSKKVLDKIDSERPIYITSTDGHNAWVNSKALEISGVRKVTKSPLGGVIERNANGEPSGILREYAMNLVAKFKPETSRAEKLLALEESIALAHEYGITSWNDAGVGEETIQLYLDLEKQGKLKMDVTLSIMTEIINERKAVDDVLAIYKKYQPMSERINMKSTKILIDGVIEGKTAALFENYVGEDFAGNAYIPLETYKEMVAAYDSAGFQVHVHACGDKGVNMTFDAFEHAIETNGKSDNRHHIVHLQLMDEKDVNRFKELDVIANLQTLWATPEDSYISELTIPVLGEKRTEWIYPFGAIANSGAKLANGSDWPVTTLNPFPAMQVAVTRRGPDSTKREPWTPQHLMKLYDVVEGYTKGGAYLSFSEEMRGTISVGKEANFVILDSNVLDVPNEKLHAIKVNQTVLRGETVFKR